MPHGSMSHPREDAPCGGGIAACAPPPAPPLARRPAACFVLKFRVCYATVWGQTVAVLLEEAQADETRTSTTVRLACRHEGARLVWEAAHPWSPAPPAPASTTLRYRYAILEEGAASPSDAEPAWRALPLPAVQADSAPVVISLADAWASAGAPGALLATAAFRRAILRHAHRPPPPAAGPPRPPPSLPPPGTVLLRLAVRAAGLAPGERVAAAGSSPSLGSWGLRDALPLTPAGTPADPHRWEAAVPVPAAHFPLTFRFALVAGEDEEPRLEAGENRVAALDTPSTEGTPASSACILSIDAGWLRSPTPWRGGGLALPLFSARSTAGLGTGEFADIPALAAWAAACGCSVLQLLPVNDTAVTGTFEDSYPYATLSVFALHPLYVDVGSLGPAVEGGRDAFTNPRLPGLGRTAALPPHLASRLADARARLNASPDLEYEDVMAEKLGIARAVFDATGAAEVEGDARFRAFYGANASWLRPYAAHAVLRALFGTSDHWTWGALSEPSEEDLSRLCDDPSSDHAATIRFWCWVQWKAHAQLAAAADAAASHGVALKGDLPIGVDPRGVDAWVSPSLFRRTASTGAPPDFFDPRGQAWGFPTYDWAAAEATSYAWWTARLSHLAQYFSALRIDHILGFFRIWELPRGATTGLLGRFRPGAAISRSELEAAGMWDIDRLADPHITPQSALAALGGDEAAVAKFTVPGPCAGRLNLAPAVWEEDAIERVEGDGAATTAALRAGLLSLRQNVLLVRDADDPSRAFHPRIGLAGTESFKALEETHPAWAGWLAAAHDRYYHSDAQDGGWAAHAKRVLAPLLAATDMLVCGEDLGMVPSCVPGVLSGLGVLGLRVQRMPAEAGAEFGDPARYPYLSVASPSTHDTPPLRAWWAGLGGAARARFWERWGGGGGGGGKAPPPPPSTCTPALARAILAAHAASPSMLAVFALQDVLALSGSAAVQARPPAEETVNDPTVRKHRWKYRCQVTVEELLQDAGLAAGVRELMVDGGRFVPGAGGQGVGEVSLGALALE